MLSTKRIGSLLLATPLMFAAISTLQAQAATTGPNRDHVTKVNVGGPHASPDAKAKYPLCGVQFTYTLLPNQTVQFFTFGWPSQIAMDWTVMDDTYDPGQPDVTLTNIATEGTETSSQSTVSYWLTVTNLRPFNQLIEGRYCYLQKTIL